jgi:hypothetical protein
VLFFVLYKNFADSLLYFISSHSGKSLYIKLYSKERCQKKQ